MPNKHRYVAFQESDFNLFHQQVNKAREECAADTAYYWQEWLGKMLVKSFDVQTAGICDAETYLAGLIAASEEEDGFRFVTDNAETPLTIAVLKKDNRLFGCVAGSDFFMQFLSLIPHEPIKKEHWTRNEPVYRELARLKSQGRWHDESAFYVIGKTERPNVIARRTDIAWAQLPRFAERTKRLATLLLYRKFIHWDMKPKLDVIAKETNVSHEDAANLDPTVIDHLSYDLWIETDEGKRMFKKERDLAARTLKRHPSIDEVWPEWLPKSF